MPPKQIKKPLWVLCETCGCDVIYNDITHHQESKCDKTKCAYIEKEQLNGRIEYIDVYKLPVFNRMTPHEFVFINQSTGNLCKFFIGEPVILRRNDSLPLVRRMWPSKSASLSAVVLPTKGLEPSWCSLSSRNVSVEKCNEIISEALEVVFSPSDIKNIKNINLKEVLKIMKEQYLNNYVCQSNRLTFYHLGKKVTLKVESINANVKSEIYQLTSKTKWILPEEKRKTQILHIQLGGVDEVIEEITLLLDTVLKPGINKIKMIQPVKGLLLFGHSGTGKTAICKNIINKLAYYQVNLSGPEIYSKYFGETEKTMKKLFDEAISNQPSIIFVDDIDTICPKKLSTTTEQEKRVLSAFVTLIDELHENNNEVFILATSNKPEMIDPALRRFGRLDKEIEIPVPNVNSRIEIFATLLRQTKHSLCKDDFTSIAKLAHGFVPADILNLCSQASMHAIKRDRNDLNLNIDDFNWALTMVKPSAMREVMVEVPNVKWSHIGGLSDLKLKLKQAVEWPLKHPESFFRLGIKPPNGVLMYGPPGCSKTMIAKALATESGLNFLSIKGPELFSMWVGESERAVRKLFHRARQVAPAIIFFDEIDALGGERSQEGGSGGVHERVLTQILTELDGVVPLKNVTIVAATNRPDRIDRALLRPGRIDRLVYVPLPDEQTRYEILTIKLSSMKISKDVQTNELVRRTEGFSGAELHAVCNEAAMKALEEDIDCNEVLHKHFDEVLYHFTPRTPKYLLDIYEMFSQSNKLL